MHPWSNRTTWSRQNSQKRLENRCLNDCHNIAKVYFFLGRCHALAGTRRGSKHERSCRASRQCYLACKIRLWVIGSREKWCIRRTHERKHVANLCYKTPTGSKKIADKPKIRQPSFERKTAMVNARSKEILEVEISQTINTVVFQNVRYNFMFLPLGKTFNSVTNTSTATQW